MSDSNTGTKLPKSRKNAIDGSGRKPSNVVNIEMVYFVTRCWNPDKMLEKKISISFDNQYFDQLLQKSVINNCKGCLPTWAGLYNFWNHMGKRDHQQFQKEQGLYGWKWTQSCVMIRGSWFWFPHVRRNEGARKPSSKCSLTSWKWMLCLVCLPSMNTYGFILGWEKWGPKYSFLFVTQ